MDREKRLIKKIKLKSSQAAANELISKYYKEIYAYVYKQTIDKELSMDLTQEIFISMLKSINSYDENKASFRTWLYKISTYRVVDYYRSKYYKYSSNIVSIDDYDIYDNEDIEITMEYKQDIEKIINIVNRLDASTQQIFRLKFFAEYTFLEISNILQISESTVKTKYYSMLKKIRKNFEEEQNEQR
ncbi:RNA polymerase sigma factor, sigma-70 family [Gottschalkia purinilytica]|uniref:RNA polymerase sigma factor, sigma-70 family n=1 Tax=Gottschalkia purinilytica TaxID=1503 RepID=A0A0L0WAC0_GOTPU|nr:sigma-70 family RNA polymerase sigma factor [Gottschalkia purinilytica]KNF08402.1 RNA polymerase sigma factor, sigma-70 family [Gottschalkia purinilytica]